MNEGCLDILNVGAGHLTFRFERDKPDELAKAKTVIGDMLRRGYMLFVKVGNEQKRVRAFDAEHEEYILEEPEPEVAAAIELVNEADQMKAAAATNGHVSAAEPGNETPAVANANTAEELRPKKKPRGRPNGVPMRQAQATGIGPTAGG